VQNALASLQDAADRAFSHRIEGEGRIPDEKISAERPCQDGWRARPEEIHAAQAGGTTRRFAGARKDEFGFHL